MGFSCGGKLSIGSWQAAINRNVGANVALSLAPARVIRKVLSGRAIHGGQGSFAVALLLSSKA